MDDGGNAHQAQASAASTSNRPNDPVGATSQPLPTDEIPSRWLHSRADPFRCTVTGDGLRYAMARQWATFTITAFDSDGNKIDAGGEPFTIAVRGKSIVTTKAIDQMNGSYIVGYRASVSGQYTISVSLFGVLLPGSPFQLTVLSRCPDPSACRLRGHGLSNAVAREPTAFEIEFIDAFGQVTHAEELDVFVERIGEPQPLQPAAPENAVEIGQPRRSRRQTTAASASSTDKVVHGSTTQRDGDAVTGIEETPTGAEPTTDRRAAGNSSGAGDLQPISHASNVHRRSFGSYQGRTPRPDGLGSARPLRLAASERQAHMTLWAHRLRTEGVTQSKPPSVAFSNRGASRSEGSTHRGRWVEPPRVASGPGTSYAHELTADAKGVAFAFGGVDPGTIHAAGRIIKAHQVHYSIGRAN